MLKRGDNAFVRCDKDHFKWKYATVSKASKRMRLYSKHGSYQKGRRKSKGMNGIEHEFVELLRRKLKAHFS